MAKEKKNLYLSKECIDRLRQISKKMFGSENFSMVVEFLAKKEVDALDIKVEEKTED